MKILHVITGIQKAAGTSVFCSEVCNELVALGHDVTLAVAKPCLSNSYPIDPRIKLISITSLLNIKQSQVIQNYDIVHIHALWTPILHRVSNWADKNKIPVVWSPHGMLTPWAMNNKKWKKSLGWWLYQRWDLKKASLIHATAQSEEEDIRRLGLKNRVVVAPLGVKVNGCIERIGRKDGKKVLLFVSRVQRKKGLLNLIKAWALLPSEIKREWVVRIVGPDQENHTSELKTLCAELDVENDFEFCGPKYGDDLAREYASADLFVLPTHSENFGSVVIEALARELPVICTNGAPWEELEKHNCGWWIDIGVEPLVNVLHEALPLCQEELHLMGVRGSKLVEEKYSWDSVVKVIIEGYKLVSKQHIEG